MTARPPVPRHAQETYRLLKAGLRPLPDGNSLPPFIQRERAFTIGAYEGEPRLEQKVLPQPVWQDWVPRWVDVLVELWVGAIDQHGLAARVQRGNVLWVVQSEWPERKQKQLVTAYDREGLRGVRELVRPICIGTPPELIEEFEARVAGIGRG